MGLYWGPAVEEILQKPLWLFLLLSDHIFPPAPLAKPYCLTGLWELKLATKEKIQKAYLLHHPRNGQRDRDLASHRAWFFPLP